MDRVDREYNEPLSEARFVGNASSAPFLQHLEYLQVGRPHCPTNNESNSISAMMLKLVTAVSVEILFF